MRSGRVASAIVAALVSLVAIAGIGTLLFLLFRALVRWFDHQNGNVRTAVVGAIAVVVVPFVTYLANRANDRRRSLNESLRLKKVELYDEAIRFLVRGMVAASAPGSSGQPSQEALEFFRDFTPRVITYGSNGVIRAWVSVWGTKGGVSTDSWHNLKGIERILKAFRKDLGHRVFALREFDLARLFVNDIDDQLAKLAEEKRAERAAKRARGRRE